MTRRRAPTNGALRILGSSLLNHWGWGKRSGDALASQSPQAFSRGFMQHDRSVFEGTAYLLFDMHEQPVAPVEIGPGPILGVVESHQAEIEADQLLVNLVEERLSLVE